MSTNQNLPLQSGWRNYRMPKLHRSHLSIRRPQTGVRFLDGQMTLYGQKMPPCCCLPTPSHFRLTGSLLVWRKTSLACRSSVAWRVGGINRVQTRSLSTGKHMRVVPLVLFLEVVFEYGRSFLKGVAPLAHRLSSPRRKTTCLSNWVVGPHSSSYGPSMKHSMTTTSNLSKTRSTWAE